MKIENMYIMWYETSTGIIQNDYTESLKGANIAPPSVVTVFCSESIAEIDAKVTELGLTDPNEVVTPH
jgi:hypothetical protein